MSQDTKRNVPHWMLFTSTNVLILSQSVGEGIFKCSLLCITEELLKSTVYWMQSNVENKSNSFKKRGKKISL